MRIYEGSPRQDFEEVFRSIGAFLDQRGMREVLLAEAPDGFIVQNSWGPTWGFHGFALLPYEENTIKVFREVSPSVVSV